jgi:hypothetical protein
MGSGLILLDSLLLYLPLEVSTTRLNTERVEVVKYCSNSKGSFAKSSVKVVLKVA